MKKTISFIMSVVVSLSIGGCAGASIMDTTVKHKQARIILFVDKSVNEDQLKENLRHAISVRVNDITEYEGLLPEELAQKPKQPQTNEQFKRIIAFAGSAGMTSAMQYKSLDLSNAWYNIAGVGGMTSEYLKKSEYYKAAIYPYVDGYKIYIYQFYSEGSDGIIGNLTNSAVEAVVGNEGALLFMAQVRDDFLNHSSAKILKQTPRTLSKINLNALGWDTGSKK